MPRDFHRPEGALLAGVCAELADRLGWNVWALRALFLAGLLVQTLATGMIYGILAALIGLFLGPSRGSDTPSDRLESEALADRGRRIRELEEKFRTLERDGR